MRGVEVLCKLIGCERAAQMIAAPCSHMDGPPDFLILDVAARNGEDLCSEAQFADFARHRVGDEFLIMGFDDRDVAAEEFGFLDSAVGDVHEADRSVFVAHGEFARSSGGHIINLASREVGDIRFVASAEAVALLCLLATEFEPECVVFSVEQKIDLHPIGLGHAEAHFFGINAHIVVAHSETCAQDGLVDPVERGASEAVLLGEGCERCRGGIGRDAENDVVVRVYILLQADHTALGCVGVVWEIEVAAAGDFVGIHFAATESEFGQCSVAERLEEELYGVFLNREFWVLQKSEVLDVRCIREVDQNANFLSASWFKCASKEVCESKWRKNAACGLCWNGHWMHVASFYVPEGDDDSKKTLPKFEITISASRGSGLWMCAVNYLTAIFCGLALLVAQYFVGRGPYPFLPLPAYAVLCLAVFFGAWKLTRQDFAIPRWVCISFAAALTGWLAIPLAGQSDLWLQGAILRLVLAAWIVYCLVVFVITGPGERLALLSILLVGSFAQAALGIFQYLFPNALPYLGWITDLCPERMEGHAFRARGFYWNANHLAWLLNFAGAFALSIGVWGRVSLWPRLLLLYGAAMFFAVGILTQSRGGVLGAVAALAVFVIISARGLLLGAWGSRGRMFGLVALALLVTLGAAWQAYESSDLAQYRMLKAGEETYRTTVWKTAFRQWQGEPLVGTGLGTFTNFARQYRLRSDALDDIFAHNDWVQALAEIGLIGVGLGFCVLLVHLSSGWRSVVVDLRQRIAAGGSPVSLKAAIQMGAMSSLAAFAVHSFFDFNMQVPANALLGCVSMAILASPGRRFSSERISVFASRLAITSALAAAIGLGLSSWNCLNSELAWIRADSALALGNSEMALEFAESGIESNPKHSALAATGGRVALALGKYTGFPELERRRLLQRSVELSSIAKQGEPGDAWHLMNLAHAYDNLGSFVQAAPLHRAAIAQAPYYATPYEFYALHLELSGQTDEAIAFYSLALHLPSSTFSAGRREALLLAKQKTPSP